MRNSAEMAAKFCLRSTKVCGCLNEPSQRTFVEYKGRNAANFSLISFAQCCMLYTSKSTSDLCYYPFLTYLDVSVFFCR